MTTTNSKTELTQIEEITIAQSGKKFLEDQMMMEEMLEQLSAYRRSNELLKAEVDRLNHEALKNSIQFLNVGNRLQESNNHLFKMLEEHEGAFDVDEKFASPQICVDYIEAAKHCAAYFGRTNNRVKHAQEWLDNVPTEKRTDLI